MFLYKVIKPANETAKNLLAKAFLTYSTISGIKDDETHKSRWAD